MKKKNGILTYSLLAMGFALILTNSCKKDDDNNNVPTPTATTVTDVDGNVYHTITIGTQVWMVENLKTTKYRNGDPITLITNATAWSLLVTGAYCNYNNDTSYYTTYGRLYNWYAVNDSRNIAPAGWHIPSDAEWHTLVKLLDSDAQLINGTESSSAGSKMKETGIVHWDSPNSGATNSSGFTAIGNGDRDASGIFEQIGFGSFLWCTTEYNTNGAWYRGIYSVNSGVGRYFGGKKMGLAVRCIKD
jgi:uncharacterized protein (TIGR02145 family)